VIIIVSSIHVGKRTIFSCELNIIYFITI